MEVPSQAPLFHAAVAGGTGLIGRAVVRALAARGDRVEALRREGTAYAVPAGVRAVVNLAGANIFGRRWNDAYREEIRASRVETTRRLVAALAALEPRPRVLVNASAIGIYGECGDEEVTEASERRDPGFLGRVCRDWEAEALAAADRGIRAVVLRIGVVLTREGGALAQMEPAFRWFAGGKVGHGRQHLSWIHLDDLVAMILWALDHEDARGVYNATAPEPVTNAAFSAALARALHRPCLFRVPLLALRVRFGEVGGLLAQSQRVLPRRALEAGFAFRYPTVERALAALYHTSAVAP